MGDKFVFVVRIRYQVVEARKPDNPDPQRLQLVPIQAGYMPGFKKQ